jgi:hypothetical protein
MSEHNKIRAAFARLIEVLTDIAQTADERNHERCPYKTAEMNCTFQGGCQNQRRQPEEVHCAGDHLIDRSPASECAIRDRE